MKNCFRNDALSAPDYIGREYLQSLQISRLQKVVDHAYRNVELFRNRMDDRNLKPGDIKTLADLGKLPFMVKQDLRDTYPFGLFAVPNDEIVRLHASSGTTGKPIVVAYTAEDLKVWQEVMGRSLAAAGLNNSDIIQISYGYGLFTGGLGAHYGAEGIGATVVPASGGNTRRQVMLIRDFGVTAICCTPSYFLHLAEEAEKEGIDLRKLPLKAGIFGAEPWTQGMRERTMRRIDRISSRSDDMFIIRGVNVFPSQIESAMLSVEGTTANYHIRLYTERGTDAIEVTAELTPELFSDQVREMEDLKRRIAAAIESVIGLRIALKLAAPGSIPRSEGKAKRVTDERIR